MKNWIAIAGTLLVFGCTNAEIETPPSPIIPKDRAGAVGVDVYARARNKGNPVPRFRGQETVSIRAWYKGKEQSGVPCNLDSGVYTAQVLTPANVVVPDYGPNSPALFVRCETESASGSVTVNSVNFTSQQRHNAAIGTGVLGAIIIGAVAAANTDNEKDEFKYAPIVVYLKGKDS